MSVIGYARVSSEGQSLDRQTDALRESGAEKIFTDKLSGKDTKRPGLRKALDYARDGDVFTVASFDRLARSLPDLLDIVAELGGKGVKFRSLKEAVDTDTPAGKFQLAIFGALAEFERSIIAERRDEGIKAARARGKAFGRPRTVKPEGWDKEVRAWKAGKQTAVQTFKNLKLSKSVFYSMVKSEAKR